MSSTEQFWLRGGKPTGPLSVDDLKNLASAGKLGPEDCVNRAGTGEWVAAAKVEGLFGGPAATDGLVLPGRDPARAAARGRAALVRWVPAGLVGLVLAGGLGYAWHRAGVESQERQAVEDRLEELQADNERLAAELDELKARAWRAAPQPAEMRFRKAREALEGERAKLEAERAALQKERALRDEQARKKEASVKRTPEEERRAAQELIARHKQKLSDLAEDRIQAYLRKLPVKDRESADTARAWLNAIHRAYKERAGKPFAPAMDLWRDNAIFREARALVGVGGAYIPPRTPNRETWADAWGAAVQTIPRAGGADRK